MKIIEIQELVYEMDRLPIGVYYGAHDWIKFYHSLKRILKKANKERRQRLENTNTISFEEQTKIVDEIYEEDVEIKFPPTTIGCYDLGLLTFRAFEYFKSIGLITIDEDLA